MNTICLIIIGDVYLKLGLLGTLMISFNNTSHVYENYIAGTIFPGTMFMQGIFTGSMFTGSMFT